MHRVADVGDVVVAGVRVGVTTVLTETGDLFGCGYTDGALPGGPPGSHVFGGAYGLDIPGPGRAIALALDAGSTCIASEGSTVACWGNLFSAVGAVQTAIPVWQRFSDLAIADVAVGRLAACASSREEVRCWQQAGELWQVSEHAGWGGGWTENGELRVGTSWRLATGDISEMCVRDGSVCAMMVGGAVDCFAPGVADDGLLVATGATSLACAGGVVCVGGEEGVTCTDEVSGAREHYLARGSRDVSASESVLCNIDAPGGLECWTRRAGGGDGAPAGDAGGPLGAAGWTWP